MAGGAIAAAVMGIASTAASTAATIANESIRESRSNLSFAIKVFNGTEYRLNPVRTDFRKGALFGGTEGEFISSPGSIDPRQVGVFSCTQILGATTDVIGSVVFQCDIFDLWVGFHAYDQAGIQRYIFSGLFPKGHLKDTMNGWDANLDQTPNKYLWSGAGRASEASKGITTGWGLRRNGEFRRGVIKQDQNGEYVLDKNGEPILHHDSVMGDGSEIAFSTCASGGGKEMSVFLLDRGDLYKGAADNAHMVRVSGAARAAA